MKKNAPLFVRAGVLIFVIYTIIHVVKVSRDVKQGELINGVLLTKNVSAKGFQNANFRCEFIINGKEKNRYAPSTLHFVTGNYLIGRYFPAKYSRKYNKLELLLLPEDFKEYGLPHPDSLRWIDRLNNR